MDNVNNRLYQLARTQIDMVKSALGKRFTFEDDPNNSTQSGYTTYGTLKTSTAIIVIRLSNHICSMKNWTVRYEPKRIANPKLLRRMGRNIQDPYKDRCFFSVVFKAFDYQPNDNGKWKAVCNEYVFNPLEVEENRTIGIIIQDCAKLTTNQPISINGMNPTTRTAIVPKKSNRVVPPNNQELNTEQYMNKKLIRLTESDLHRIVKESVNMILREAYGNIDLPVRINYDPQGIYKKGEIISIHQLVNDFCDTVDDKTAQLIYDKNAEWAVKFIADKWGLDAEYLG